MASVGPGRIVSLPAAVQRSGNSWLVPVDFMRLALGPALGLKTDVRRPSHLVIVGDVRLPEVTARFERAGGNGRLTVDMSPPAASRVTREGSRLIVRLEAAGIDLAPPTGLVPELVSAVRAEGAALTIDLGSLVSGYRAETPEAGRLVIDVLAAGAPPPPPKPVPTDPPVLELPLAPGGGVRTIVLDPGHGGADVGVTGPGGTREKDYVLDLARRLKAAIESRLGLRVLLTRDEDELVPVDRRTSMANNNKADLFISLHANASRHSDTRGTQVLTLNAAHYQGRLEAARSTDLPVPVVTGGSRAIDMVPWDLAQMPFADASARVAEVLVKRLTERKVPLYTMPVNRLPLRPLVGANMPAVLIEAGFLSSAGDESVLKNPELSAALVEAIVDTVSELRRDGSSPSVASAE
jgi:N-acetylmuramoyl-L-alanine amidase